MDFCDSAAECGLRSFIIMAGALDGKTVKSELLSYEGPFGVGYAISAFEFKGDDATRQFDQIYNQKEEQRLKQLKENEDEYVSLAKLLVLGRVSISKGKILMDLVIRNVKISDLEKVTNVEACCFPEAEAATRKSLEQRIKTYPDSFFVAELNDTIIGFINGCITNDTVISDKLYEDTTLHNPNGNYQAIFGLDVLPEYRMHGIATILMNHMIQITKRNGRKGIILTCKDKLIPFYSKFGYENKGISQSVHGGAVWNDMILTF